MNSHSVEKVVEYTVTQVIHQLLTCFVSLRSSEVLVLKYQYYVSVHKTQQKHFQLKAINIGNNIVDTF